MTVLHYQLVFTTASLCSSTYLSISIFSTRADPPGRPHLTHGQLIWAETAATEIIARVMSIESCFCLFVNKPYR